MAELMQDLKSLTVDELLALKLQAERDTNTNLQFQINEELSRRAIYYKREEK